MNSCKSVIALDMYLSITLNRNGVANVWSTTRGLVMSSGWFKSLLLGV